MATTLTDFASTATSSAFTSTASTASSTNLLLLMLIVCLLLIAFHSVLLLLASASGCTFVLFLVISHVLVGVRGSLLIAVFIAIASMTVSTGSL